MPSIEDNAVHAIVDRRLVRGSTVVTLAGELDIAQSRLLRRMLVQMPAAPLPNVVVDLRQVEFIDCSVLRTFVSVHRSARLHAGCLRLVAPRREPLHLLRMSRLDGIFCLHRTLEAAVEPVCATHVPAN